MKLAIVKVINGNFFIHSEGIATVEAAIVQWHGVCQTLWNAPDVITAEVAIVNEQLDVVEGYKEFINKKTESTEPVD